jgi:hypothetical protein
MNPSLRGVLIAAALCLGAALVYWFGLREHGAPAPAEVAPVTAPPAEPPKAPAASDQPLPDLAGSDGQIAQLIDALLGAGAQQYFLRPGIVRRIVATVDALPRGRVPLKVMPVRPVQGSFQTAGSGPTLAIGPENAQRYARYVGWLTTVDTPQLVAAYRRNYPLFRQAYRELGYPNAEFNDRLVDALDDLLEAPAPPDPVLLTVPRAMFEYADPALEDASAGQKILMRMGRDNQERALSKLRELRRALDGVELPR